MPNFKNFANGGIEDGSSTEFSSVRHKQVRENKVGSRIERVWAIDFERCESREDFEKYISKYGKYDANKYVEQARIRIESIDADENARIERENTAQRVIQRPVAPGTGGSSIPPKNKFIQNFLKIAAWIIIIGGVGLYSYNQYQREEKAKRDTTEVVIDPQPSPNQYNQEEYTTHTHSEQVHEHETPVVEPEEPERQQMSCMVCGQSGRCSVCFGSGRCGGCGGGGQIYSVFYDGEVGPGRMTDCSACGGTGACGACNGSGLCPSCEGRGFVEF